jgi:hypothetical protein
MSISTSILGLRGTGQFSADFRPTNYRELFTLLEPNGTAPLNALLSMASSESTDDPKYNNFRDELPDRVLTVAAGGALIGATSIPLADNDEVNFAVTNVLLLNTRTNEIVRATASPTTTPGSMAVTVVRGASGSTAAAMNAADKLVVIGFADVEGGGKPTPVTFDPVVDFNYTQIFKTGTGITNTQRATFLRTGDKESEMLMKGLKLHMGDIERAMFWSRRHEENGSSNAPRRSTGGLFSTISNVIDASTGFAAANTINETEFDQQLITNIFAYGSKQKTMFAGARVIANLQKIAKGRWQPYAVNGSYGVTMTQYSTFAGDLNVHLHPMFRQIPGMDNAAVILDLPHVKYRYMEGRDTQLKRDVQANDADGKEHFYLTECGLELLTARPHWVIRNWTNA